VAWWLRTKNRVNALITANTPACKYFCHSRIRGKNREYVTAPKMYLRPYLLNS